MGERRPDGGIGAKRLGNEASTRSVERDNWPTNDSLSQTVLGMAADNKGI